MRGAICDFIGRVIPSKPCVCQAANGVAAIQKARERAPDLAILDLSMPMLYGVDTAARLRDAVPHTKVIGLAMYAEEFCKSQLAASGFAMIVSKQAGLGKLAEAINALLPAPPPTG